MGDPALNVLQVSVLRLFFSLPESNGFILAGGAGLVAAGLSTRPTDDIDLFAPTASVAAAGDALDLASQERGWTVMQVQNAPTFRRLVISAATGDQVLVDLARDAGPRSAPMVTTVGPTYPPEELAARKVLALFDRAALRDFVDVANVVNRYGKDQLLQLAAEIDAGFDPDVFAEMAHTLDRFSDDEINQFADAATIRSFFQGWVDELGRGPR